MSVLFIRSSEVIYIKDIVTINPTLQTQKEDWMNITNVGCIKS